VKTQFEDMVERVERLERALQLPAPPSYGPTPAQFKTAGLETEATMRDTEESARDAARRIARVLEEVQRKYSSLRYGLCSIFGLAVPTRDDDIVHAVYKAENAQSDHGKLRHSLILALRLPYSADDAAIVAVAKHAFDACDNTANKPFAPEPLVEPGGMFEWTRFKGGFIATIDINSVTKISRKFFGDEVDCLAQAEKWAGTRRSAYGLPQPVGNDWLEVLTALGLPHLGTTMKEVLARVKDRATEFGEEVKKHADFRLRLQNALGLGSATTIVGEDTIIERVLGLKAQTSYDQKTIDAAKAFRDKLAAVLQLKGQVQTRADEGKNDIIEMVEKLIAYAREWDASRRELASLKNFRLRLHTMLGLPAGTVYNNLIETTIRGLWDEHCRLEQDKPKLDHSFVSHPYGYDICVYVVPPTPGSILLTHVCGRMKSSH
jgi:hypothetical protein